MRKLVSFMLALVMILSLAIVAGAEEVTYAASEATSFDITKTYTSDEEFVPGETLTFTVTANSDNPDATTITVGTDNTYTVTGLENTISVSVPSFAKAGIYKYTIKEVAGSTAGVTTYDTEKTIHVSVLVEYDNENNKLVIGNPKDETSGITYFIEKVNGEKTSEFKNVFQTNDFTVAKDVQGNMANENDKFEITVTLTALTDKTVLTPIQVAGETVEASAWNDGVYTKVLTISESDGAVTFADIPYGVAVTVAENTDVTKMNGYTSKGYTVNGNDAAAVSFSIDDDAATTDAVVVINEKTSSVDTGITMDSLPYILILVVACGAAVLFVINKRRSVDF